MTITLWNGNLEHGENNLNQFPKFLKLPKAKCGSWCYVDEDASCLETKPSTNSEYHWTCEACNGEVFFTFVLYLIFKN